MIKHSCVPKGLLPDNSASRLPRSSKRLPGNNAGDDLTFSFMRQKLHSDSKPPPQSTLSTQSRQQKVNRERNQIEEKKKTIFS